MKILYLITMSNGELYQNVRDTPLKMEDLSSERWMKIFSNNNVFYLNIAQIISIDMREIPEGDD